MAIADNTTALRNLLALANGLPSASSGPAYGKAVVFGDSLALGVDNNNRSFVDLLAESGLFESVTKRAYGGSTIGPYSGNNTTNEYCLVNQVMRYASDVQAADIIFIEYCGNEVDALLAGRTYPGLVTDSESTQSMSGYTRKAFNSIRSLNPSARLIWLAATRWKAEGAVRSNPSSGVDWNDPLLCLEATVYRIADEYRCGIIDLYDGINHDAIIPSGGVHPNEEGHMLIAQNVVANMFKNTELPKLVRKVNFVTADNYTATADIDFAHILAMLKAGIEFYGESNMPGNSVRCLFKCTGYRDDFIAFNSNAFVNDNYYSFGFIWTPDGISLTAPR